MKKKNIIENIDQLHDSNSSELDQLIKDYEFASEHGEITVLPSRASIKRRFLDLDLDAFVEIQKSMEELNDQFGTTNTNLRHLSQNEIDSLVEELLVVRKVGDILSSREDSLKTFAKDIISLDQVDPDTTSGSLVSPKHKLRISKEIRGGTLKIDINLLKKRLSDEQFKSVTNEVTTTVNKKYPDGKVTQETIITYEVNEQFLEKEMVRGNIYSEDIYLSSVPSKRTTAIYIREMEE